MYPKTKCLTKLSGWINTASVYKIRNDKAFNVILVLFVFLFLHRYITHFPHLMLITALVSYILHCILSLYWEFTVFHSYLWFNRWKQCYYSWPRNTDICNSRSNNKRFHGIGAWKERRTHIVRKVNDHIRHLAHHLVM